jgi:hypothetical protein
MVIKPNTDGMEAYVTDGEVMFKWRRNRSLPKVGYDVTAVTPDTLAAIQKNENKAFVSFQAVRAC